MVIEKNIEDELWVEATILRRVKNDIGQGDFYFKLEVEIPEFQSLYPTSLDTRHMAIEQDEEEFRIGTLNLSPPSDAIRGFNHDLNSKEEGERCVYQLRLKKDSLGKDKDGKEKPGTKYWDFYWRLLDIQLVEQDDEMPDGNETEPIFDTGATSFEKKLQSNKSERDVDRDGLAWGNALTNAGNILAQVVLKDDRIRSMSDFDKHVDEYANAHIAYAKLLVERRP